ncbi:MAG: oligosaccharide flippase family protein [Sakamotonia sp.]|jgi:stage V sporulation protein B
MHDYLKKHTLAAGALILTLTGFASRILGFFYRIFLSRTIGAEGLGIYQMVFPVYGICFSVCAGSIQTAISRFTAADRNQAKKTLLTGFIISFTLALGLAAVITRFSGFLADRVLMEPGCAPLLPAMALAIPCTSVHACLCGWYYGKEQVQVPAFSQLVEQCIRIFTVFLVVRIWNDQGRPVTVLVAVAGLVAGEAGSALFTLLSFLLFGSRKKDGPAVFGHPVISSFRTAAVPLMAMALPLMGNRLVMNVLQSLEAILIPSRLELSGLSRSQSLSLYGVLTGMAIPFVMFPSAIINSLAVVLLPSVARHQSLGNRAGILKNIAMSFRYSSYMGILCIGIFTCFGHSLGLQVFRSAEAGSFISILAWLCPFLYLATTMGSILNGLGKTSVTFFHNLISLLVRLAFVFFGIPRAGIRACLWGMLAGELILSLLHLHSLRKLVHYVPNAWEVIVKPAFCLTAALGIYSLFPDPLPLPGILPPFFMTILQIGLVCTGYLLLLLLFHNSPDHSSNSTVT